MKKTMKKTMNINGCKFVNIYNNGKSIYKYLDGKLHKEGEISADCVKVYERSFRFKDYEIYLPKESNSNLYISFAYRLSRNKPQIYSINSDGVWEFIEGEEQTFESDYRRTLITIKMSDKEKFDITNVAMNFMRSCYKDLFEE